MVSVTIVVVFILLFGIIQYGNARAWKNRPRRLCTNCYTLAQPLRHKNKRWYCGTCGADNPAPLDSPIAQAYLTRQNEQTKVIEGRRLP